MNTSIEPNFIQPIYPIVRNEAGELVHQTPEAFHHGFIKGDSPAAQRTRDMLKGMSRTVADLNAKRVNLHPTYNSDVEAGFRGNSAALTEARQALRDEARAIEEGLIAKTGFKADPAMKAIVVGTFQAMRPEERVAAISKLVEQNDGATLAVLHDVSNVFTSLSDELRATIKTRLYSHADAHAFGQLQQVRANLARVETASIESANAYAAFAAPQHRAQPVRKEVHKSVAG